MTSARYFIRALVLLVAAYVLTARWLFVSSGSAAVGISWLLCLWCVVRAVRTDRAIEVPRAVGRTVR